MTRLIDDLIDVARITSGKIVLQRARTSLTELVQIAVEVHRATIEAASIDLTVELPEQSCVVDVDPTRFVQILSNLLHNSSKFTPANGKIRCSAEILAGDEPPRVAITVADTGIGISKEVLPRMFGLFAQGSSERAHGGLGIGLALARRLTEMHGGQIFGHSDGPGRGATFVVTMPLCGVVADRPVSRPGARRIASRVVIIDDNYDAADMISMLVETLGGAARTAHDASSGLVAIQEFRPDVVFLDIGLPGMDGYEACRRIREEPSQRHIIVVAVTGWGQTHDKQRAFDAGFDGHLTKPVDPAALVKVLTGDVQPTKR
jgi:CheY-like chemotaxis protein